MFNVIRVKFWRSLCTRVSRYSLLQGQSVDAQWTSLHHLNCAQSRLLCARLGSTRYGPSSLHNDYGRWKQHLHASAMLLHALLRHHGWPVGSKKRCSLVCCNRASWLPLGLASCATAVAFVVGIPYALCARLAAPIGHHDHRMQHGPQQWWSGGLLLLLVSLSFTSNPLWCLALRHERLLRPFSLLLAHLVPPQPVVAASFICFLFILPTLVRVYLLPERRQPPASAIERVMDVA